MRILAAPDKFRGSLSAPQAAAAIAAGARAAGHAAVELPLADGGEGTLDALGGANRETTVTGPLGAPVSAGWRLDGGLAVVEAARASGLLLAGGADGNDPLAATSRGTGELIAAALREGAERVIVGVGGSAMTDGGAGAVDALRPLLPLRAEIVVACDVETAFLDAPSVFGPQKGATPDQVRLLRARLEDVAGGYEREFGLDVRGLARAGAAGGLAGGLAALGAELAPGFALVAELVGLDAALAAADLVVTGEGSLDATSFAGKVVGGVAEAARRCGVPVLAVAGVVERDAVDGLRAWSLVEEFGEERAWREAAACLAELVARA